MAESLEPSSSLRRNDNNKEQQQQEQDKKNETKNKLPLTSAFPPWYRPRQRLRPPPSPSSHGSTNNTNCYHTTTATLLSDATATATTATTMTRTTAGGSSSNYSRGSAQSASGASSSNNCPPSLNDTSNSSSIHVAEQQQQQQRQQQEQPAATTTKMVSSLNNQQQQPYYHPHFDRYYEEAENNDDAPPRHAAPPPPSPRSEPGGVVGTSYSPSQVVHVVSPPRGQHQQLQSPSSPRRTNNYDYSQSEPGDGSPRPHYPPLSPSQQRSRLMMAAAAYRDEKKEQEENSSRNNNDDDGLTSDCNRNSFSSRTRDLARRFDRNHHHRQPASPPSPHPAVPPRHGSNNDNAAAGIRGATAAEAAAAAAATTLDPSPEPSGSADAVAVVSPQNEQDQQHQQEAHHYFWKNVEIETPAPARVCELKQKLWDVNEALQVEPHLHPASEDASARRREDLVRLNQNHTERQRLKERWLIRLEEQQRKDLEGLGAQGGRPSGGDYDIHHHHYRPTDSRSLSPAPRSSSRQRSLSPPNRPSTTIGATNSRGWNSPGHNSHATSTTGSTTMSIPTKPSTTVADVLASSSKFGSRFHRAAQRASSTTGSHHSGSATALHSPDRSAVSGATASTSAAASVERIQRTTAAGNRSRGCQEDDGDKGGMGLSLAQQQQQHHSHHQVLLARVQHQKRQLRHLQNKQLQQQQQQQQQLQDYHQRHDTENVQAPLEHFRPSEVVASNSYANSQTGTGTGTGGGYTSSSTTGTNAAHAGSVATLLAKLQAVNRDNPNQALAQIDAILQAESQSSVEGGTSGAADALVDPEECDEDDNGGGEDDDDEDETTVSSITNPTYTKMAYAAGGVGGGQARPSTLHAYGQPANHSKIQQQEQQQQQPATTQHSRAAAKQKQKQKMKRHRTRSPPPSSIQVSSKQDKNKPKQQEAAVVAATAPVKKTGDEQHIMQKRLDESSDSKAPVRSNIAATSDTVMAVGKGTAESCACAAKELFNPSPERKDTTASACEDDVYALAQKIRNCDASDTVRVVGKGAAASCAGAAKELFNPSPDRKDFTTVRSANVAAAAAAAADDEADALAQKIRRWDAMSADQDEADHHEAPVGPAGGSRNDSDDLLVKRSSAVKDYCLDGDKSNNKNNDANAIPPPITPTRGRLRKKHPWDSNMPVYTGQVDIRDTSMEPAGGFEAEFTPKYQHGSEDEMLSVEYSVSQPATESAATDNASNNKNNNEQQQQKLLSNKPQGESTGAGADLGDANTKDSSAFAKDKDKRNVFDVNPKLLLDIGNKKVGYWDYENNTGMMMSGRSQQEADNIADDFDSAWFALPSNAFFSETENKKINEYGNDDDEGEDPPALPVLRISDPHRKRRDRDSKKRRDFSTFAPQSRTSGSGPPHIAVQKYNSLSYDESMVTATTKESTRVYSMNMDEEENNEQEQQPSSSSRRRGLRTFLKKKRLAAAATTSSSIHNKTISVGTSQGSVTSSVSKRMVPLSSGLTTGDLDSSASRLSRDSSKSGSRRSRRRSASSRSPSRSRTRAQSLEERRIRNPNIAKKFSRLLRVYEDKDADHYRKNHHCHI